MADPLTSIIIGAVLIALLIGSYTDFKTREVPDWLSFSLIAVGLGSRALSSAMQGDLSPLINGIIGLVLFVILGMIMYYTAQWGGGDAKLLMGIGAATGFELDISSLFFSFLFALIFIGAVYGLAWTFSLAILNWKAFACKYREIMHNRRIFYARAILLAAATGIVLLVMVMKNSVLRILLIALVLISYLMMYLYFFIKAIEQSCMLKKVQVINLTEGDWVAEEVKAGGKLLASPKDLGISRNQIAALKRARIKHILIKEGIPFVPSFLLAFLFAVGYGNILIVLVGLA